MAVLPDPIRPDDSGVDVNPDAARVEDLLRYLCVLLLFSFDTNSAEKILTSHRSVKL